MKNFLKKIFTRKPKSFLNNEFKIIPAFSWKGEDYYMYEDHLDVATGRGLYALKSMEELLMRCDEEYLSNHVEAIENILSNRKKIDIPSLARLHQNLKERTNFLTIIPRHLYKLASVVFFTKAESPYSYDEEYNKKKIKNWSEDETMYNFLLYKTQLGQMLPFMNLPQENSDQWRALEEKIDKMHLAELSEVKFKNELTNKNMN